MVVDPFAGVGRIHRIAVPDKITTIGLEIEPPWAACHPHTFVADALDPHTWPRPLRRGDRGGRRRVIDVFATSVTYGNRFSDSHDAQDGSTRRSYAHDLAAGGHPIAANNSGVMPWGARYRRFHADAYRVLAQELAEGGLFILNVSAFIKGQEVIDAPLFHLGAALAAGFEETKPAVRVDTKRMTHGANRERVEGEIIYQLRRPHR